MLPVYYTDADYQAGVEALIHAFNPASGLTVRESVILTLGQHFNVWTGSVADDPQAEPGFCTAPLPIPAKLVEPDHLAA